jgi:hypothetical protein
MSDTDSVARLLQHKHIHQWTRDVSTIEALLARFDCQAGI